MNFLECYVCEYSNTQSAFHIETAYEMIQENMRSVVNDIPTDYIPFFFCETYEKAVEICDLFNKRIREMET